MDGLGIAKERRREKSANEPFSHLEAMASNLLAMASNLLAMASTLRAMASNLEAI